ncbi:Rieske (2Fe-2S) protein, partial [Klebsiella pneumoniae]|nr:Rieske (2Fe-2S) protein [Klebsiella pneumoniae]
MVRLCRADSLAEGQARGFDPTGCGQATVIACRYQGTLYLWRNRCPHLDTPM